MIKESEHILNIHKEEKHSHLVYALYLIGFLFGLSVALPAYINSSYLNTFGTEIEVSAIYTLQSLSILIGFLSAYPLIKKYGNYKVAKWLCLGQLISLAGLIAFNDIISLGITFIIHGLILNILVISNDIFVESISNRHAIGKIRGFYFTFINLAWVLAPTFSSSLIENNEYWRVYVASAFAIIPILFILKRNFSKFKDPVYPTSNFRTAISKYVYYPDFRWIALVNIILNLFYSWMVIYMPIYLHKTIGLSWTDIGLVLTIMLIPFVIVDAPLGKIADSGYGEKKIMIMGTLIMALSTIIISFIDMPNIIIWAIILFMTRIGAATMEIMIETYFFKKIHAKDSDMLSIFRMSRPIAYLFGPILFTITTRFIDTGDSFLVLGLIILLAIWPISLIKDKI